MNWYNLALSNTEEEPSSGKKKVYKFKSDRENGKMKLTDLQLVKKSAQGSASKFEKYDNQPVVFIAKDARLILSNSSFVALGKPTHVRFYTDGKSIVAITPATGDNPNDYHILKGGGKNHHGRHVALSVGYLLKELKIKPPEITSAFKVEFREGAVWLDLNQFPARL
jgi:hypothetical protein